MQSKHNKLIICILAIVLLWGAAGVGLAQEASALLQYNTLSEYEEVTGKSITEFSEAPPLSKLVEEGKLPPVEERLPEEPVVIEPLEEIGKYGGALQGPHWGSAMQYYRITYEPLVRWNADTNEVIPNIAKSWEVSDEGRVITLYLREGMKWSDGEPFTADDVIFWYEDIICNEDLTPVFPSWLKAGGKPTGEPGKVEKVDDYTVRFVFESPYTFALQQLASRIDGYAPRHYLEKYHPRYTPMDEIVEEAKKEGFDTWYQLFLQKAARFNNKELPVITAWKVTGSPSDPVFTAERNPYYWKVDTAGNQLPYIDRISWMLVPDREVRVMKYISGETSITHYETVEADYTLVMENREKGGYRVFKWIPAATSIGTLFVNQNVKEPVLRELLTDVQFRRALSLAINREEIVQLVFAGLAIPRQHSVYPGSPYYEEKFEKYYIEYDPEKANQMLDEIGLTERDSEGYRLRPDGKTLEILFEVMTGGWGQEPDIAEMVRTYLKDIGIKVNIKPEETQLWVTRARAGEQEIGVYGTCGAYHPLLDPVGFFPIADTCYWAPLYGLWYSSGGKSGEEPTDEIKQLLGLYEEAMAAVTEEERIALVKRALEIFSDNLWAIGIAAPEARVVIVKNELRNVLDGTLLDNVNYCPGHIYPEQWFFKE